MNIYEKPLGPSGTSNGEGGREYLISMIRSLSALARRWREDEFAILLDAIIAAARARERARR